MSKPALMLLRVCFRGRRESSTPNFNAGLREIATNE